MKNSEISPLMENEQPFVVEYNNKTSKTIEKLPLLHRNLKSGWPLLQVSLFSLSDKEEGYFPVLGGGKCHYLHFAHYFFALMLTKVYFSSIESNLTDISKQIHTNFKVHLKQPAITVSSQINNNGRMDDIRITDCDMTGFNDLLLNKLNKYIGKTKLFGSNKDSKSGLTEESINESIDTKVAIFHNGQIFIDLGELLNFETIDKDIKEILASIFQVSLFNELKPNIASLPPSQTNEFSQTNHNLTSNSMTSLTIFSPPNDLRRENSKSKRKLFQDYVEKIQGENSDGKLEEYQADIINNIEINSEGTSRVFKRPFNG